MQILAQIKDNKILQFVGFNTVANAVAHCQEHPDALFIQTEHFGEPSDFEYDPETGEIARLPPKSVRPPIFSV